MNRMLIAENDIGTTHQLVGQGLPVPRKACLDLFLFSNINMAGQALRYQLLAV